MCWREIACRYLCLQEFFFHSEGCLFLSLMVSFAVQMLLMFIRSHCLFLFYFHDSMRWIKKEVDAFYVKACSLLKSFIVSVLLFRSLISLEFIFVYGARELSNFILIFIAQKPSWCLPQWLLLISIPSISIGGFPLLYTLSRIYCLLSFHLWPFWLVWGGTSLKVWFAFHSYLVKLTSLHVIF